MRDFSQELDIHKIDDLELFVSLYLGFYQNEKYQDQKPKIIELVKVLIESERIEKKDQ